MASEPATTLREQQTHLTRELILGALVKLLEDEDPGDISVPEVAQAAGVSLRTVYRHFPTREELFAAAAEWINEQILGGIPFDETEEELGEVFRQACERFDEQPKLVR